MPEPRYQYLFGPVPSRRLGRSLGIDPVPHKTCSFDCVYCQLGPTTLHTTVRRPYVRAAAIIAELARWLEQDGSADCLTLSGSGEPTLNSEVSDVLWWAKSHTLLPVAVLTNASLLWDPEVRKEFALADLLIPSLDAALPASFERVNRPCAGLCLDRIIAGLIAMREEFRGQMWLEVLLVEGLNSSPEDLAALARVVHDLRPDRVQINTVVRPPAETWARPLSAERLREACALLGPNAEIIAPLPEGFAECLHLAHTEDDLVEMLRRRPCTMDDIADGLGIHRNEAAKHVAALLERGRLTSVERDGRTFYLLS